MKKEILLELLNWRILSDFIIYLCQIFPDHRISVAPPHPTFRRPSVQCPLAVPAAGAVFTQPVFLLHFMEPLECSHFHWPPKRRRRRQSPIAEIQPITPTALGLLPFARMGPKTGICFWSISFSQIFNLLNLKKIEKYSKNCKKT